MSKALESVLTKLNNLSIKMNDTAADWSMRSEGRTVSFSDFEAELNSLKDQLSTGSAITLSGFLQKQIFLNPSLLNLKELKTVLELSRTRFPKLKKHLLIGWRADSAFKKDYYLLLSDFAKKDNHYSCPEWLEDWNNLRDGETFISFINSRNINFSKITSYDDLPKGQLQRLIYTYEVYKSNYRQNEFFQSLELLRGKIPIISSIGDKTKDVNIYNDIENILVVAAVLNCRLIAKKNSENFGKLDEIMNQILLNSSVGDPRMNSVDPFWHRVSTFSNESYQDWLFELNREDFKFFFHKEILGQVNDDRVDFWSKYLGSMKRVQIVLSPEMRETLSLRFGKNEEVMRTINRAKYYLRRSEYCTAIFYFEKHICIENHKTGAACYYFSQSNFKELDDKLTKGSIDTYLTFTNVRDESWPHNPRHAWMKPFSEKLAYLGIYENSKSVVESRPAYSREYKSDAKPPMKTEEKMAVDTRLRATIAVSKPSTNTSVDINAFLSELSYSGAEIIDNRSKKGKLWIVFDSKLEAIINRMKSAGHRVLVARTGSHETNNRKAWWVENND